MSQNHQSDDNLKSNDLLEDDQCCSTDDCSGDEGSSRNDNLGAIRLESGGQSRRRRRGHGHSRDDDDSDKVTGIKGKGYTFDLGAGGIVTNLMRVKRGVSKPESIDSNESWTFIPAVPGVPGTLIKTEIYPNGRSEVKTYIDDPRTAEVLYIFASEQFL